MLHAPLLILNILTVIRFSFARFVDISKPKVLWNIFEELFIGPDKYLNERGLQLISNVSVSSVLLVLLINKVSRCLVHN